jgi:single-strand DNA-binding protein
MPTMNVVMVMGNLTKDPEVRSLPSGIQVADLRLALNEEFKDRNGVEQKKVCYVDVQAWDKQADFCGKFLVKGDPVLIEGKLDYHEWQTDQGEKRNKLRVRASRVTGLKGSGEPVGSGQSAEGSRLRKEAAARRGGQQAVGSRQGAEDSGQDGEDTPF